MDSPQTESTSTPRFFPAIIYGVLLLIGIPWYWPVDDKSLLFGVPVWVVVAVSVSFVASCFTAWLLRRPWPGEAEEEKQRGAE